MYYAIYLKCYDFDQTGHYGYWSGQNYKKDGCLFPITDDEVMMRTKLYSSKKRAEKGLGCCLNKGYEYAVGGEIREVKIGSTIR